MDSGNSGSMQSSDEEYESFTSFLNPSGGGTAHFGSLTNHHHQQQPPQQQYQYGNDDDDVWSRELTTSQNNHHPNFENFVPLSSSSSPSSNQSLFGLINPQFATSSSSSQSQSIQSRGAGMNQNNHHHHHQSTATAKNPKKRTRASRRAPTTVLTTDTTNFRQMVQEFTGIPAAPFSTSPYYSQRLNLFSGSGNLDPLRPSTQKLQFLPQSSSSSCSNLLTSTMIEALVSAANSATTNNASTTSTTNNTLSFQQQQPTSLRNSASILGTNAATTVNANVTSSSSSATQQQQGVPVAENVVVVGNINYQQQQHPLGSNYQSSSGEGTIGQWVCADR